MVSNLECFGWLNDELREYITCGAQGNLPSFHTQTMPTEPSGIINDNPRNTPHFQQTTPVGMRFKAHGVSSF